jgi:hypothetical protein
MKRSGRRQPASGTSTRRQNPRQRPLRRRGPADRAKTDSFDLVRKFGLSLPDVEEATMYGTPALKVRGKMFACIASHKSAEPGTLVIRMDFDQRDELIATDPSTYYLTDHYVGYTSVLVRLSRVHPDALRDLLLTAWRFMSAGDRRRVRPRTREIPAAARRR